MRQHVFKDFQFRSGQVVWDDLYFDEDAALVDQPSDLRDDLM